MINTRPARISLSTIHAPIMGAAILCSLAGFAVAQDSVSRNANGGSGLPGDGLSAFSGTNQRLNYIVDLTSFRTSGGTQFGLAPVLKSGRVNAARLTAFNGASSISQTAKLGAAYPAASYSLWTAPGGGVNSTENDATLVSTVNATGSATVFAAGFMDFDELLVTTTSVFTNQMYGGMIAFDPADPSRLYVSRVNAAINAGVGALDRSQFGYGGVDADGNLCFRADSFGSNGTATTLLVGENYFRIRLAARTASVNLIDNAGGSNAAATDWLLQRSALTHATPSCIPQHLAGRPL
ncbi:MAG: hypothetical protein NTV94_03800, partial [Planctomycetota bacterium]|nr:hypothetical protein [Planctomycetota bacterium]